MGFRSAPALLCALLAISPGAVRAQDYESALRASLFEYAPVHAHAGVTLSVACSQSPQAEFIKSHVALFEEHSSVKVKFTILPADALHEQVAADARKGGHGFQAYCLESADIPYFASKGWLRPLDPEIKPSFKIEDLFDNIKTLLSWQGRLYGFPVSSEVTLLYYRKDLLEKAGVAPPKTLDEFTQAAARLHQPPAQFGAALRGRRGVGQNVFIWTGWLRGYGGNFLDQSMVPVFDGDAGIEATTRYAEIIRQYGPPGSGAWSGDDVAAAFAAGQVGLTVESSAYYARFGDAAHSAVAGKVGFASVPAGPKGAFPGSRAVGFVVPAAVAQGSRELDAALDFLQWATSQEMEFARTEQGIGDEDRRSVNASALLYSKADQAYIEAVNEAHSATRPQYHPLIPQWRQMGDVIGAHLEEVFTGKVAPKDGLTSAAGAVADQFAADGVSGKPRVYPEIFANR